MSNAKLRNMLNDGSASLLTENQRLRWECAAKDAENATLRATLSKTDKPE